MCGKFTTKLSWTELVDFAWPVPDSGEDRSLTLRVMDAVPLIVLDIVAESRRVVPMRWGFPHPRDWKRPQPIHARAETIDTHARLCRRFRVTASAVSRW
jgi:putative SOS response-associated peptidase YedK